MLGSGLRWMASPLDDAARLECRTQSASLSATHMTAPSESPAASVDALSTRAALRQTRARSGASRTAAPCPCRLAWVLSRSLQPRASTPWLAARSVLSSWPRAPCVPGRLILGHWGAACCAQGALSLLEDSASAPTRVGRKGKQSPVFTPLGPHPPCRPRQAPTRTSSRHLTGEPAGEAPLLPPVLALACFWAQPPRVDSPHLEPFLLITPPYAVPPVRRWARRHTRGRGC
jgi:hypothetical protein